MDNFAVLVDSASNLSDETLTKFNIDVISYQCFVDDQPLDCFIRGRDHKETAKKFYESMRQGADVRTTLVNSYRLEEFFTPYLENGQDILFVPVSSAVSGTYWAAVTAAEELSEKYGDRKILIADPRTASLGQGILAVNAAMMRDEGRSIDEAYQYIMDNRDHMVSEFTVGDIMYLKRGGRVSSAVAIVGALLGIKPLLMGNDNGEIVLMSKARGMKKAIDTLFERCKASITQEGKRLVGISHCDNEEMAHSLAERIKNELGVKEVMEVYHDLCTGAHVGPGTVAIYYLGRGKFKEMVTA